MLKHDEVDELSGKFSKIREYKGISCYLAVALFGSFILEVLRILEFTKLRDKKWRKKRSYLLDRTIKPAKLLHSNEKVEESKRPDDNSTDLILDLNTH